MSEIQIYSEGFQLVMVIDGVRVSLNISAAEQLRDALTQSLPLLQAEHEAALAAQSALTGVLKDAEKAWDSGFEAQLQLACEILATGQSHAAFEVLSAVAGTQLAWIGLATILHMQPDGWISLKPQYPSAVLIGLSELAAEAASESALSVLWHANAWDMALLKACESLQPSELSELVRTRVLQCVQQSHMLPAGRFLMGAEGDDAWAFEGPIHEVTLSQPIQMMRFPVTQILYWRVTGLNPSLKIGATRPVEQVSWLDACRFCNALSLKEGLEAVYIIDEDASVHWDPNRTGYRLPTEAEWERAAQGGQSALFAGSHYPEAVAWYEDNSEGTTHAVGQKKANGYGLHDMCGNVWEWCWDGYDAEFYAHEAAGWDPVGSLHCSEHVCRGGSYLDQSKSLRVSLRGRFDLSTAWSALGFRLVIQKPYRHWEQKDPSQVTTDQEET